MKYCEKCGKEMANEAIICPNCGRPTGYVPGGNIVDDQPSVGLCILAALFPIFGWIYWAIKTKETPKRAQACGITGIVSFVIGLLVI